MFSLDDERQCLESEMHRESREIFCRFTGRSLGEIGKKPTGFDPMEMPDFEEESAISPCVGEDAKRELYFMRLCGRGISRLSSEIWDDDD